MARTGASVLGIDVGTTSVKAALVGLDGRLLAEAETEQRVSMPRPGWAEQDPETWWTSTRATILSVMNKARRGSDGVDLCAIGLTGQMHSSVFLDGDGLVIRPALLWNDVRTTAQCSEITDVVGLARLRRMVGNRAVEGFTAPKLLWLRQNESANYSRLRTLLLAKDYVRYRLTGELATELSDAAGTQIPHLRLLGWLLWAYSRCGVSTGVLIGLCAASLRGLATVSHQLSG